MTGNNGLEFVADVHIGNHTVLGGPVERGLNRRCRQVIDVLARTIQTSPAKVVVILGDLFDVVSPDPRILAATAEALAQALWSAEHADKLLILKGNHDAFSDAKGDHCLGVLGAVPRIEVVDFVRAQGGLVLLPFHSGKTMDWLPEALDKAQISSKRAPIIGMHVGISDENTPPYLSECSDSIPFKDLQDVLLRYGAKNSVVMAGNWHERRTYKGDGGIVAIQVGALVPTGFDNPGAKKYGHAWCIDPLTRVIKSREIPGPRFFEAESESEVRDLLRTHEGAYVRLKTEDAQAARGVSSEFPGVQVILQNKKRKTELVSEIQGSHKDETLRARVHRYCTERTFDGTTPAEVSELCVEFLGV